MIQYHNTSHVLLEKNNFQSRVIIKEVGKTPFFSNVLNGNT